MWMCPSCKTAHICFLPGASGTMPDHVIEEPPALPDFGVDSSVLLAHRDPPIYNIATFGTTTLPTRDPPPLAAEHEIEIQHCHSNGNKMYCHMYMCEHHHIKPTSTVLEFLKQKKSDMLRSHQSRGKHVVITELHLLAVNTMTRRKRTLRDEAILNECLFEDERLQCVATMFHLPPVADRWTDVLLAAQKQAQEIMNSTHRHCQR